MLLHYPDVVLEDCYLNGGVERIGKKPVDLLLLDMQMPNISGDELYPKLRRKYPDLKILILSNFDSALYAKNLLKRGGHTDT